MSSKVIKQQGFKQQSSKKHVKTRTPYSVVEEYEKEFKYEFGQVLGQAADEFIKTASKQLNTGLIRLKKGEDGIDCLFEG